MWFIFITACLFNRTLLTPRSRDPNANALYAVNSLIRCWR